jgi:hypothetical protein
MARVRHFVDTIKVPVKFVFEFIKMEITPCMLDLIKVDFITEDSGFS